MAFGFDFVPHDPLAFIGDGAKARKASKSFLEPRPVLIFC